MIFLIWHQKQDQQKQGEKKWDYIKLQSFCTAKESDSESCSVVSRIFQARILSWVAFPFSRGSSQPRSPALQADFSPAEPQGKPRNTGAYYLFFTESSRLRNWTGVLCIAGGFFTNWAIREAPQQRKASIKWKDNQSNGRKSLQIIHLFLLFSS